MANLSKIPLDELVDDYYASLMDAKACERLGLEDRAETNRKIMEDTEQELERRGELDKISR